MTTSTESVSIFANPKQHSLKKRVTWRYIFSWIMDGVVGLLTLAAFLPLFSVLYMVTVRGLHHLRLQMFWQLPPAAGMEGGGFGNAIVGTFALVGIAAAVSVPVGVLTAVMLTEFSAQSRSAKLIRFTTKVLSGIPSILAGVFIYAVIVLTTNHFSIIAGGLALAILMLPIVVLSTEQALLRVARELREASLALGATNVQTILRVTIPACGPAIITGVMLAVARAAGETAPILFTALFSNYWLSSLSQPTASLAVLIYNFSSVPFDNLVNIAWTASFVLMMLVMMTNIVCHFLTREKR